MFGMVSMSAAGVPEISGHPADFLLHIGAHKTASTHLQSVLQANQSRLRGAGCAYFGPEALRGDLKLPRVRANDAVYRRDLAPLRAALQIAQSDCCRILISEENIHGGGPRPPVMAQGSRYYPNAVQRIIRLLDGLETQSAVIALALREPGAHLVSGWGHQYLAGRPMTFSDYIAEVDLATLQWSELVTRLRDSAPVSHLILWRQEDYADLCASLVARLTGVAPDMLDWPEKRARLVGPSARAIAELPALQTRHPELSIKQVVRRAMRRFPKSSKWPAPDPIAPELRAQLRAAYAADWAKLQRMPGVTCLTP